MRIGRAFHIKIVPEDLTEPYTFKVTMRRLIIGGVVLSVLMILLGALVVNSAVDEIKLAKLGYLERQNKEMTEKMKKVGELKYELGRMNGLVSDIQEMLGERVESEGGTTEVESSGEEMKTGMSTMLPAGGIFDELRDFVDRYSGFMMLAPVGNPVGGGWISRGFGSVISGEVEHKGIDIAVPEGTEVRSTMCGRVIFAGWDEVYGNMVLVVNCVNGYSTMYGHNSELMVNAGDYVNEGDVIALSGNTGESTAPHLHYEVRYFGVSIDPKDFIEW